MGIIGDITIVKQPVVAKSRKLQPYTINLLAVPATVTVHTWLGGSGDILDWLNDNSYTLSHVSDYNVVYQFPSVQHKDWFLLKWSN